MKTPNIDEVLRLLSEADNLLREQAQESPGTVAEWTIETLHDAIELVKDDKRHVQTGANQKK